MPIIKDPKMNPNHEEKYGVIEMDEGSYVAYNKVENNLDKRYLPWGWEIRVSRTERSETPLTEYKGDSIYDLAVRFNFHGRQGLVIKKIQRYICSNPDEAFQGTTTDITEPHQAQDPVVTDDDDAPNV